MTDINEGFAEKCNACGSFDVNRQQITFDKRKIKVKAVCQKCFVFWFEYQFSCIQL
jgi:hypothetical protein